MIEGCNHIPPLVWYERDEISNAKYEPTSDRDGVDEPLDTGFGLERVDVVTDVDLQPDG